MNHIPELLRKKFGLSQEQLAAFAGIDRSHLARVEAGSRGVGDKAAIPLVLLKEAADRMVAKRSAAPLEPDPDWQETCRQQSLMFYRHVKRKEQRLAKMEAAFAQANALQQCLQTLQSSPGQQLSTRQQRWIEEQQYQASLKMERNRPGLQQKLRFAIRLAKAMAEVYAGETGMVGGGR